MPSNWQKLLTVLIDPLQDAENTLQQLLTARYLATATGIHLDAVGALVGQARGGVIDDDLYRRYIGARVATNRSRGLVEDLIKIARLIIADADATVVVGSPGNASIDVAITGAAVTEEVAAILVAFLKEAVAAGVRVVAEWHEVEPDDAFTLASAAFLNTATLTGATTLELRDHGADDVDALGWPRSGQVILDQGTAVEEYVTFANRDADTLLGCSATTHDHAQYATVTLVDGVGLGFAAASDKLNGAQGSGAATVTVDSTAGFTSSGTITIDGGTSLEDVVAYTSKTGTVFTLAAGVTTAQSHLDDALVTQGGGALGDAAD